ncbi:MAG TPA: sigma-70 family RNA polymerase sigma factor [Allocoleopsis sp.]
MKRTKFQSAKAKELLIAYHRHPSVSLRNQLVKLNMGLVCQIAYKISLQCAEPLEDLQQIGYLGLIRAIERYNPDQGATFSCFAVPYIKGEILHFLRDKSAILKIPRRLSELQGKGQKVYQQLTLKLGRNPQDSEISEALNISLEEWQECKKANINRWPLSLDVNISKNVDDHITLGESLADQRELTLRSHQEDRLQLENALTQLETKIQDSIKYVYINDLSRQEAAKCLGVSPMTISRNVQKGLNQLVSLLQSPTEVLA